MATKTDEKKTDVTAEPKPVLTDEMLARFAERAPKHDRESSFFHDDFGELRKSGYLIMAVPKELGGGGLRLDAAARNTRRLAYYAPATALAINMHIYWTGVAAEMWRSGDKSVEWLLREAVAGEVFAAGHAETGNDLPGILSTTKAEPFNGGYKFTGRKAFGSLTPVWTRLGVHGMDTSDPKAPKIVHAFLPRNTRGVTIKEIWDVLGMRATRSDDTILESAYVPREYVARVVPAGFAGVDFFVLSIFAWGLTGAANIYYAMAQRALDMTVESVKKKTSLGLTRSMAYHPEVQHAVADMRLDLESIGPQLDKLAEDWTNGVNHGADWAVKILATKYNTVEAAWRVIDKALDVAGGFGIFNRAGFERLFRDGRLGRIHPGNYALTHEVVGKITLGINPDELPRWG